MEQRYYNLTQAVADCGMEVVGQLAEQLLPIPEV